MCVSGGLIDTYFCSALPEILLLLLSPLLFRPFIIASSSISVPSHVRCITCDSTLGRVFSSFSPSHTRAHAQALASFRFRVYHEFSRKEEVRRAIEKPTPTPPSVSSVCIRSATVSHPTSQDREKKEQKLQRQRTTTALLLFHCFLVRLASRVGTNCLYNKQRSLFAWIEERVKRSVFLLFRFVN